MFRNILRISVLCFFVAATGQCPAAEPDVTIRILYAEQKNDRPPVLSGIAPVPEDLGLQGARLGVSDNVSGGKFLGRTFRLEEVIAKPGESLLAKLDILQAPDFVILNAPADVVTAIADLPGAKDKIIFNVAAYDERLREEDCRVNVLHTLPSRAMLTDALAQFLVAKKWTSVLLMAGARDNDKAYAESFRHSAAKFNLVIVADKPWELEADLRESAATEIPLLTQDGGEDVVVVADENDDFGPLIPYNTFFARPVVGTHGLRPAGWSHVIETWGARQLQNRFEEQASRPMRNVDFAAYIAVRVVGEGALRLKTTDAAQMRQLIVSEELRLSAFKGRGLTFRDWNGQMRQPIHLVTEQAQIADAPFESFLHEVTDLDTLGLDRPETKCTEFNR